MTTGLIGTTDRPVMMRRIHMSKKDRIVKEVRTALDGLFLNPEHGDWDENKWKGAVRTSLCKAGKACGANKRCSLGLKKNPCANQGAWLYDVACVKYKDNDNDKYLEEREVLLVAQVTWGNIDTLPGSFVTLPVARAAVRVMVHNCTDCALTNVFTKCISEHVGSQAGDRYLFAVWTPGGFVYHDIDFRVSPHPLS